MQRNPNFSKTLKPWHPKLFLFVIELAKVMNYFFQWLLIKVLTLLLIPIYSCAYIIDDYYDSYNKRCFYTQSEFTRF